MLNKPDSTNSPEEGRLSSVKAIESSNDKSSWGGARPGAGRPKGSMNPASKERAAAKKEFQDRVAQNVDRLFNAQFNLATGEQYLMWRHKVGMGVKEKTIVEVIDDPEVIKQFINEELDNPDDYYFISTKPANNSAVDSMLDRAFGKADSKIENTGDQTITVVTRKHNAASRD